MKKRKSTSMFIGHTTRGIAQPVLFDTHTQIYNNKPPMTLITGAPGSGKDLDINTLIPTPYGFTKMGSLRTGDKVLNRNFQPCRVTFAGEIEERETYKITFSDKREIIAGEEHQWSITLDTIEEINDKHQKNIREKKKKLLQHQANLIKNTQKNPEILFNNKEWGTVPDFTKALKNSGAQFWNNNADIEKVLKRYNVLHQKKFHKEEHDETKQLYPFFNVYMGLQAIYEETIELSEMAPYNEKVVTTKELITLMKKTLPRIRTSIPVDNSDMSTTGHLDNSDTTLDIDNLSTITINYISELSFGSIRERRSEIKELLTQVSRKEDSEHGVMVTYVSLDRSKLDRILLLAHSLGANAYISEDGDSISLESKVLENPSSIENNWVSIVGVDKLDKRKTRCISVDSPDHVYLAGEGFIPTHNTFYAMTLTCLSAVLGKTTIVLDPKGDFLSLNELKDDLGSISFWALKDRKKAGILDPFYMAKNKGERLNLVIETLSLFLGGLTSEQLQILAPVIKDVMNEPVPSLLLLTESLQMSEREAARQIGAQLDLISKLPFANLCFAPGSRRQKDISIDEGITVITMAGLELSPDSGSAKAGNKARLSSAVFFLITDYIRRVMHDSADTKPKTVIIDEAWAVLATEEGARVIKEISLLARSKNLALVLITQNTSHLDKIDVENTISSRFAFRTDAKEGKTIVENMGLPIEESFEQILTDLEQGECLMNDWQGRYSTVQISQYNTRWKEAFETNPLEKMKKQKEREAKEKLRLNQEKRRRH